MPPCNCAICLAMLRPRPVPPVSRLRVFNLFSPTLPVLFENKDKIKTVVENTGKGSIVTQTTPDPKVAAALQAHALEVDELARDGMAAMMRGMRARMMGRAGSAATPR